MGKLRPHNLEKKAGAGDLSVWFFHRKWEAPSFLHNKQDVVSTHGTFHERKELQEWGRERKEKLVLTLSRSQKDSGCGNEICECNFALTYQRNDNEK